VSQGGLFPRWRPITKRVLDLFGRWGDPRTNLRSMMDGVIPVVIVDRFRDDDEGSLFGISAFTIVGAGFPGQFPSISFGSGVNDWELVGFTAVNFNFNGQTGAKFGNVHLFTPIEPYNPALNLSPVGTFPSGLLMNRSFTFGSVSAIAGYNPVLPAIFGPTVRLRSPTSGASITWAGSLSRYRFESTGTRRSPFNTTGLWVTVRIPCCSIFLSSTASGRRFRSDAAHVSAAGISGGMAWAVPVVGSAPGRAGSGIPAGRSYVLVSLPGS